MDEIIILDIDDNDVNESILKNKRLEEIDSLVSKNILSIQDKYNLEYLERDSIPEKSNVPSLQLVNLLNYFIPIINSNKYSVPIQLNYDIPVINEKNKIVIYNNNEIINVNGIFVPNYIRKRCSYYNGLDMVDFKELKQVGRLSPHQIYPFEILLVKNTFIFNDENEFNKIIVLLSNYLDLYHSYINESFPFTSRQLVNKEYKTLNYSYSDLKYNDKISNNKLIDMIQKISTIQLDERYYYQTLSKLDQQDLLRLLHIAEELGADSDEFTIEYENKLNLIKNNRLILNEMKKYYEYFNKLAMSESMALDIFKKPLEELSKKERQVIDQSILKLQKKSKKLDDKLSKLFYELKKEYEIVNNDEKIEKLIDEIEKYTKNKRDSIYESGNCPHELDIIKLKSKDMIKDRYCISNDDVEFYCKICGSLLFIENTTISFGNLDVYSNDDDPLYLTIWKEVAYIVSTNVKFIDKIPIKSFISKLSNNLRDVIFSEQIKISKSKTISQNFIKYIMSLKIGIYIYASMAAIMYNNPGKLFFGRERSKKGGNVESEEQKNIRAALMLILISKEPVIRKVPFITTNIVKEMFNEAYTWAKKYSRPIHQVDKTKTIDNNNLTENSFMRYYETRNKMKNLPLTMEEYFSNEIKTIIKNKGNIYKNIKIPSEIPNDYMELSWYTTAIQFKNEFISESVIPLSDKRVEFANIFSKIIEIDKLISKRVMYYTSVFKLLEKDYTNYIKYHDFEHINPNKAKFFCKDGNLHKVGSYLYFVDGKEVEYTRAEIINWIKNNDLDKINKFKDAKLLEEICSLCKARITSIAKSDKFEEELEKIFERSIIIEAFYIYYEIRCPEGNLHEINNLECKKCKFKEEFIKNKNTDYYNKYIKLYLDSKTLQKESEFNYILDNINKKLSPIEFKKVEWKFSLNNVNEWSKITGVKYNILVNIGLTEGRNFNEIEQGLIDPSKEEYDYVTRSINIKNHIINIIRIYNQIFNKDINTLSKQLQEIINKEPIPKKLHNFNFISEYINYKMSLSEENYVNYLLEYLAEIILTIEKREEPIFKKIYKYFTTIIVDYERILSKPPRYISDTKDNNSSSSEDITENDTAATNIDSEDSGTFKNNYDVENINEIYEED